MIIIKQTQPKVGYMFSNAEPAHTSKVCNSIFLKKFHKTYLKSKQPN